MKTTRTFLTMLLLLVGVSNATSSALQFYSVFMQMMPMSR